MYSHYIPLYTLRESGQIQNNNCHIFFPLYMESNLNKQKKQKTQKVKRGNHVGWRRNEGG